MKSHLAILVALWPALATANPPPALHLEVAGATVPVFAGRWPACDSADIPDAPARAIRLADGSVELYASDQINRINIGSDLLHLHHDCAVVYRGAWNDDPAAYDDRAWIATPWTADGITIWAIIHNEFHGHRRPALCPTKRYMDCWYNALTMARSDDGGRHFNRVPDPAIVAALPYRYDEVGVGHHGYFNPSNIVEIEGHHAMFAFATRSGAQREGNCLLRTDDVTRPETWRSWNGATFDASFADPYRSVAHPERQVCAPIEPAALRWPVTSLAQHQGSGLYVAIMQNTARGGGAFYATSPDLLHWSRAALLLSAPGLPHWQCGDPDPIAYPALIDPSSPDRNFATVGSSAHLYFTRFDGASCDPKAHRSLASLPVQILPSSP